MTNASKSMIPRAAWFEALLALVTASCLAAQFARATAGPIGFWLALFWGMATALVASRSTQEPYRVWGLLALAQLAISAWAADSVALAALWLPALTIVALRALEGRSQRSAETVPVVTNALAQSNADAQNDCQHSVEWSQVHDRSGAKTVSGVARLTFRPGERQAELHLAFCPSFPAPPAFHVEQTGGPDVRVKTTQVMPYGARLEVQRADAAAWCVVALDFTAAVAAEASDAAPLRRAS